MSQVATVERSRFEGLNAPAPTGGHVVIHSQSLTGMSSLPLEILLDIFCLVVKSWSPKSILSQIFHICSICRYWRHICFETPMFWSQIDAYDVDGAQLMLQRCVTGPIDLCARSCRVFSMGCAQFEAELNRVMLPHRHRIRSVEISSDHFHEAIPIFLSFLNAPMPMLRSVKLHRPYWPGREQPQPGNWAPILGKHASLRSLDLSYVHLPLESDIYRNMVQLSLRSLMQDPHRLDGDIFVAILESSPRMKILELEFAGPGLPRNSTHPAQILIPRKVIQLSELQKVSITDKPANLAHTLSHFTIPHMAQTSLSIIVEDITKTLSSVFSPGSSLITYTGATESARISSCSGGILLQLDGLDLYIRNPCFKSTRTIPPPDESLLEAVLIFLDLFPKPSPALQITLCVPEKCFLQKEWDQIIHHPSFSTIRNLKIEGNANGLFSALMVSWPFVTLPALEQLTLHGHFLPLWGLDYLEQYLTHPGRIGLKLKELVLIGDDFTHETFVVGMKDVAEKLVVKEQEERGCCEV